jgi:hypothetical protein
MISFQNSADHSSYLWTPFKQITLIKLTEQSAVFIHSQKQLPMNDFLMRTSSTEHKSVYTAKLVDKFRVYVWPSSLLWKNKEILMLLDRGTVAMAA